MNDANVGVEGTELYFPLSVVVHNLDTELKKYRSEMNGIEIKDSKKVLRFSKVFLGALSLLYKKRGDLRVALKETNELLWSSPIEKNVFEPKESEEIVKELNEFFNRNLGIKVRFRKGNSVEIAEEESDVTKLEEALLGLANVIERRINELLEIKGREDALALYSATLGSEEFVTIYEIRRRGTE
ncbi:hypothetical protein EYM_01200 [Ignicoccus islandicus DSM 13165]|uniref:Uncharacterized protein n=1 Tax=Ignicoccus islandicus DSM 13165 TaxID=940295 RepID=A0A0U3E2P0_9CREN|nr:hypothetical protein [Ignicoccus islandicus]ALU12187.1 hypothetical protein EYM_01200 [Ignicoccus islandicus DSM 13165]